MCNITFGILTKYGECLCLELNVARVKGNVKFL